MNSNYKVDEFKSSKIALVLSGGVIKAGAWHLGVSLALEELGFSFKSKNKTTTAQKSKNKEIINPLEISTFVGSSAGSMILLYFVNGFKPKDIINSFVAKHNSPLKALSYKDMMHLDNPFKKRLRPNIYDPFKEFPFIIRNFIKPIMNIPGFFNTKGLKSFIEDNIIFSNNFDDYAADLFIVTTQLDHSRKVVFSRYNYPSPINDPTTFYYNNISISEAAAASMSVPPFYVPYPIFNEYTGNTDYYIDGEIRDTLSTHVALDNKAEYIISSWTHTPYDLTDDIGSLINYGLPAIVTQSIYLMIQKKIVVARNKNRMSKDIIDLVSKYMKDNKMGDKHRNNIVSILERKLDFHKKATFIDIFPTSKNYNLFLKNVFSLNPENNAEVISMGYERTLEVFKNREWNR